MKRVCKNCQKETDHEEREVLLFDTFEQVATCCRCGEEHYVAGR